MRGELKNGYLTSRRVNVCGAGNRTAALFIPRPLSKRSMDCFQQALHDGFDMKHVGAMKHDDGYIRRCYTDSFFFLSSCACVV